MILTRRAYRLPLDLYRLAGVAASAAVMAGTILVIRSQVHETGLLSLVAVSASGGAAYAGAAWLFNVAEIRTVSRKLIRSLAFNRDVLEV